MNHAKFLSIQRAKLPAVPKARPAVEALETRVVPYAATGNAWPHPELVTISFVPDGTNLGGVSSNLFATFNAKWSTATWQNQILRAAQVWAQRSNLNFVVVSDSGAPIGSGSYVQGDPTMGDIRIGGYNFGSSTLATGYIPPPANNYSIAGDIEFNTGQVWAVGATYDLFTVAAHEFGHALGLSHSTDATAVMYGSYNTRKTDLSSDDISGLQAVYSAPSADRYDIGSGNGSFGTAADITSLINSSSKTALVDNLDITTTSDVDFFTFTAPPGTSSSLTVKAQSKGLSLFGPALTVYAADQSTVLGTASGTDRTGNALSVTVTNVTAGKRFYVRVAAADTSAFGTGAYSLTLNFGTGASPSVTSPTTQTFASSTPQTGGGQPNDTLLPNNVVTQVALGAVNTVTTLGSRENLEPGTMPHGPGCCCPLCKRGGYSPDAILPTPIIVNAESVSGSEATFRQGMGDLQQSAVVRWQGVDRGMDSARLWLTTESWAAPPSGPGTARHPTVSSAALTRVPLFSPVVLVSPSGMLTPFAAGPTARAIGAPSESDTITAESDHDAAPVIAPLLLTPESLQQSPLSAIELESGAWLPADGLWLVPRADSTEEVTEGLETSDASAFWYAMTGMAAVVGAPWRSWRNNGRLLQRLERGRGAEDRRRAPRFPCWLNSYCWQLGKPLIQRCRSMAEDISTWGVKLVLRRPFDEGTVLLLELEGSGTGRGRRTVGRVVHVVEPDAGIWELGCVFAQIVEEGDVQDLLLGGLVRSQPL